MRAAKLRNIPAAIDYDMARHSSKKKIHFHVRSGTTMAAVKLQSPSHAHSCIDDQARRAPMISTSGTSLHHIFSSSSPSRTGAVA